MNHEYLCATEADSPIQLGLQVILMSLSQLLVRMNTELPVAEVP